MRSHLSFAAALLVFALPAIPGAFAQEPNPIPTHFDTIYPSPAQAQQDLDKAMRSAAQQHKRIILDFGSNESADSQVLATFFENHINESQVSEHFIVVPVNVGKKGDQNKELTQRLDVPVAKGQPVLVVLDPTGQVLTRDEDFRLAHNMSPNDLTVFLNQWRQLPGNSQQ